MSTAAVNLRAQTVSLLMPAVRGGASNASLLTGVAVTVLGVRHALLVNGVLALATQFAIGYAWWRRLAEATIR